MKPSDDLFELIKSLTKNEKGYFKKYSSLHTIGEQNKYMALFDAIEKQKEYNEQAILKKFANEQFVKHLHVAKKYLYNSILKSTEHYGKSIDTELKNDLIHIEFLHKKSLYDQCLKLIAKAKSRAEKYEKHHELALLEDYYINIITRRGFESISEGELESLFNDSLKTIEKIKNIRQLEFICVKLSLLLLKKGIVRTANDRKIYDEIMNDDLLKSEDKALSFRASLFFHLSHMVYANAVNNTEKQYYSAQKVLMCFEEHPHQIPEKLYGYTSAIANYIIAQLGAKKYNEIYKTINKLRSINQKSEKGNKEYYYVSLSFELESYNNTGNFHKGLHLADHLMQTNYSRYIHKYQELVLNYQCAYLCFGSGEYSKSVVFLNKVLNNTIANVRGDIYIYSKILFLIVHYEMGNDFLLGYMIKSIYRFLKRKNSLYKIENTLLIYIQKLLRADSHKGIISLFKELKIEIEKHTANPYEAIFLRVFDLVSWLESKIENESFAEIVKRKAKKVQAN